MREKAKGWMVFFCGLAAGQAGLWAHLFGWVGAIPAAIAMALMIAILVRDWQRACRKCGHLQRSHSTSGCLVRVDFYKEKFCPCDVDFERVKYGEADQSS